MRPPHKKKLVSFPPQLAADMKSYCREKGIESESELVRQAVGKYVGSDYEDGTLGLRGIAEAQRGIAELRDMTDILFRYVRLMHINLLAYHPELDPGDPGMADAAFNSANARHAKFFAALQDGLRNDPPFFERLLHKYFTEAPGGEG